MGRQPQHVTLPWGRSRKLLERLYYDGSLRGTAAVTILQAKSITCNKVRASEEPKSNVEGVRH
jgi:hypothetical protein